jgi:hypothetical protein
MLLRQRRLKYQVPLPSLCISCTCPTACTCSSGKQVPRTACDGRVDRGLADDDRTTGQGTRAQPSGLDACRGGQEGWKETSQNN